MGIERFWLSCRSAVQSDTKKKMLEWRNEYHFCEKSFPSILLAYPKDFPLCTYSDREFSSKSLVYVNKCLGSEWRSSLHVFIAPFIALYADSCWFVHLGNRVCTLLYVSKNKLLTSSERPTSIPVFFLFYYSLRYFWVRRSP